ncbi:MAG: hypothetical protein N0C81_11220 [Candidatus Thiodiazotropha lotti]|nr:hypothetical protein [Candidatus Thiodiazotropha lotti]MCG8003719.1 hypothetical protein [Candidatus Thiodiazotropha lotti]MCG8008200.1 hypothetical protein [Candidatus Thiodiazotropha lotti]MCW4187340.1 hypothetical protein [Candidatus Thiodiazotropha lotti]MCW4195788.1 hypothetical protein [Candidatus Thiodiazotropha lotti]
MASRHPGNLHLEFKGISDQRSFAIPASTKVWKTLCLDDGWVREYLE